MQVLIFIGTIIAILLVWLFVVYVNKYTENKYNYEFFNMTNYGFIAIGYVLIYFGKGWYTSAMLAQQDLLNGQLLMGFGAMLILGAFYYNIKNTSLVFGIGLTVVQCVIYLPLAILAVIAVVAMFSYFAETKLVYNVNGK